MKIWVTSHRSYPGGDVEYAVKFQMEKDTRWDGEGTYVYFSPNQRNYIEGGHTRDSLLAVLTQQRDRLNEIIDELRGVKNE